MTWRSAFKVWPEVEPAHPARVPDISQRWRHARHVLAEFRHSNEEKAVKQLAKLFEHTLMDIYYAENQILKALPKLAKGAEAAELKEAFKTHLGQTREQIERLEQIFEMLGKPAKGTECEAIKGILKEGDEVFDKFHGSSAQDAGMIAAAQAVEHYEIARYGALRTWAQDLGMDDAAGLLEATLSEERETDDLLSSLAESKINADAT